MFAGDAGAVNNPLALMVPPLADQFTEEPAPAGTVALHCEVALGATNAGLQETVMPPSIVTLFLLLLLPPQPASTHIVMYITKILAAYHRCRPVRTKYRNLFML